MRNAVTKFSEEVSPERKGWKSEQVSLKRLCRDSLVDVPLFDLIDKHEENFVKREINRGAEA